MSGYAARPPITVETISVLAVAVVLTAVHFLVPSSIQNALAFDHARFAPHTLLTAAYLHASNGHLLNNLVGYAMAALYAFAVCLAIDERRWFRRTVVVQLLVVPVLVNLVSYTLFQIQYPDATLVSRGFSGVVSGFVGFLLVTLYVFVRQRHSRELGYTVGLGVLFVLLQLLDLRYAGRLRPSVTGLLVLGGVVMVLPYLRDGVKVPEGAARKTAVRTAGAIAVVGFILGYLLLRLFPPPEAIVADDALTNVFGHAAGVIWGIVVSIGTWRYNGM